MVEHLGALIGSGTFGDCGKKSTLTANLALLHARRIQPYFTRVLFRLQTVDWITKSRPADRMRDQGQRGQNG